MLGRLSMAVMAALFLSNSGCSGVASAQATGAEGFLFVPQRANALSLLENEAPYLNLNVIGWGPNWSWTSFEDVSKSTDGSSRTARAKLSTGATLTLEWRVSGGASSGVELNLSVSSDRDTAVTAVVLSVEPDAAAFQKGNVKSGSTTAPIPVGIRDFGASVGRLDLTDAAKRTGSITIEPAGQVSADGGIRIALSPTQLKAGQKYNKRIRITPPASTLLITDPSKMPDDSAFDTWFPFLPATASSGPDEISLAPWLDAPAGKAGRVKAVGDKLTVSGKPIKLWGINVCYADCAPPEELADRRAEFYARNGINAVRLHKYADGPGWAGIQSSGSFAQFDSAALDRMDYFVAKLKEKGIYVKLSPTFGVKLGTNDREAVPYHAEFGAINGADGRLETRHGSVFLSKELQDLQIAQTVRLLQHKNPYTGLTYAQDPAIAIVEMFNEDSVLFYGTQDRLQKIPTLRNRAASEFAAWLRAKYGNEAGLKKAWGDGGLNTFAGEGFPGESLDKNYIVPAGNPWFYDPDQLKGSQRNRARRLLDTMEFLTGLQDRFYSRFEKAVRASGYSGEMLASNWIAGRGPSHYWNLLSDSKVGMIDRHNYFGGGEDGRINDASMLAKPGSGIFSMGATQVAGRPFSLSEWIHVFPNEWGAEGPAILSAYGMGLQGWDVSFIFQNRDDGTFSSRIGRDQWDATAPQVIGLFPALSRMIHRSDVKESDLVIPRNVSIGELRNGNLGFDERQDASGDVKDGDSETIPIGSLAVGKSVVSFGDSAKPTTKFDLSKHEKDGALVASTNQLRWTPGRSRKSGFFIIDTPGTRGVVGFAKGYTLNLGGDLFQLESKFATVTATALDKDATLATGKRILVTAIARARSADSKISGSMMLVNGKGPVLMEPVIGSIKFQRGGSPKVSLLDAYGRKTGRTASLVDGILNIDGRKDRTCYYLLEY